MHRASVDCHPTGLSWRPWGIEAHLHYIWNKVPTDVESQERVLNFVGGHGKMADIIRLSS